MAEARRNNNDAEVLPTDALKDAGQQLLSLLTQRAAQGCDGPGDPPIGTALGNRRERRNGRGQRVPQPTRRR